MPLTSLSPIFKYASSNSGCIGCFTACSYEFIHAIVSAAITHNFPAIVSIPSAIFKDRAYIDMLARSTFQLSHSTEVPIALHLNHCRDLQILEESLSYGFTSLMFDGSSLPFDENIKATQKAVKLAKSIGASLEGEVRLSENENKIDEIHISISQAAQFARETGIHCLAASLGDGHGMKDGQGRLDFLSIENLACLLDIPLALHKGSNIKYVDLQKAVSLGVRKVNFNSELQSAFLSGLDSALRSNPLGNTNDVLQSGYQELFMKIQEKFRVLQ
jgi:ketose-bisphosphate aldolase